MVSKLNSNSSITQDGNENMDAEPSVNGDQRSKSKKPGSTHRSNEKGHIIKHKGISWPLCSLLLIAGIAGGGIVAIPAAVQNTYFIPGVLLCLSMAVIAMYTCILLGKCWVILQKRHPEYHEFCRQVYAEIAFRAMGPWAKNCVSVTIDINQLGTCIIYLLLSAKSITEALNVIANIEMHYCIVILILAVILWPVTFLRSPEDFWQATFGAMACSVLAVLFIIIGSGLDYPQCALSSNELLSNFDNVAPFNTLSALGTIVFAFGGHAYFPVILHDMKRPSHFTRSSYLAYVGITLLYVPMAIVGFLSYGGNIKSSIINSIQTPWAQQTINVAILLHCIMAFLLVINPLNLDIEERVGIAHHFGPHRVAVRSIIMFIITFLALSVPNFGPILDLIGSSTTLSTVLIFPIIFYFYLNAAGNMHDVVKKTTKLPEEKEKFEYSQLTFKQMIQHNDKRHLIFGFSVMAFGLVIFFCASISAIYDLAGASFELPCYIQWFMQTSIESKPTFCCGAYGNVSAHGGHCKQITRHVIY